MPTTRGVSLTDLARLRWALEPAAHPVEPLVAYVVSGLDPTTDHLTYELVVADPVGTVHLDLAGAREPRWSPDGSLLAYAKRVDDRWLPECRSMTGEVWRLTESLEDFRDLRWAPDGRRLLGLTSTHRPPPERDRPYRATSSDDFEPAPDGRAWILEPDAKPVLVAGDLRNITVADWSPDGDRIAVISDTDVDRDTSTANGLWVWDTRTGQSECLVDPAVPILTAAWSPDGASIGYIAATRNNAASALNGLWIHDLSTGGSRRLAATLDRSIGKPIRGDDERAIGRPNLAWAPDSSSLSAIYADGGRSRLARFDLNGDHEDVATGVSCVLEFSEGGAGTAFSWSDPVTPGEISWLESTTREVRQLTNIAATLVADLELEPTMRVSTVASDGAEVEGWLTMPRHSRDVPLVLQVHGGPHYAVGERFSFDAQRLAAQGIGVLRANPRGSQGYGQAFADGNLGDWGGRDLDDLMELLDAALAGWSIDADRVAIIGESYGGYIAAWAAGTSDRFSAVVIESGISDFLSSARGPVGPTFWHSELGGAPWDNPATYLGRSVITRLDQVTAPVLVIHCEADTVCPIAHGEAIHASLRALGRKVEFLRVPEEDHFFNVFGALSRRLERTAALDDFLVTHLGVAPQDNTSTTEENGS
ncbi:MAG: prolyl oligopeptidase family serine peptidase [Acidimicrobiia bacterium]|nr:prolyl oligopeptidase family serine peptidase [Acidimicrobiia bacterium]